MKFINKLIQRIQWRRLSGRKLLTAALIFLLSCAHSAFDDGITKVAASQRSDGKTTNVFYLFSESGEAVMMDADSNGDENLDNRVWISFFPDQPETFRVFFEQTDSGNLRERIWYGPNNLKLVAEADIDGDGRYESRSYYNGRATPKTLTDIVARVEMDRDNDRRTDVWYFPGSRLEVDVTGDGRADRVESDPGSARAIYLDLIRGPASTSFEGLRIIRAGRSWAENPASIAFPPNQSTILHSLPW